MSKRLSLRDVLHAVVFASALFAGCGNLGTEQYVVSKGDTGVAIAERLDVPFSTLERLNPNVGWSDLRPGQRLRIPELHTASFFERRTSYEVQPGDTGIRIASRFGVPFRDLVRLNPRAEWNRLRPGMKLVLPKTTARAKSGMGPARRAPESPRRPETPSSLVIVYDGQRLKTINPRVFSFAGSTSIDNLPLAGTRPVHLDRRSECLSRAGQAPIVIEGRSISRHTIQLYDAALWIPDELTGAAGIRSRGGVVVFCHQRGLRDKILSLLH